MSDHVSKHLNDYVSIVQCSNHIIYQIPNYATRVRNLIRSIESTGPKLLATIVKVETDDNLMFDFEAMAAYAFHMIL